MKEKMREIISKEELKWLSKNIKRKPKSYVCKDCPLFFLANRRDISCVELIEKLEKPFGIYSDTECSEINRIIYNFFRRNNQNKI